MAVLEILIWPDERLSRACAPVGTEALDDLITDMFETMYAALGRGLAAPQVGVMKRLFVMDCTWKDGERTPMVMIDPAIVAAERVPVVADEGCLSIPGAMVPVARHKAVTVRWTDGRGDLHMGDFDGFEGRCIQHELDHLNGIVTFERIAPELRRDLEGGWLAERGTT